jgi:hypothetical protein
MKKIVLLFALALLSGCASHYSGYSSGYGDSYYFDSGRPGYYIETYRGYPHSSYRANRRIPNGHFAPQTSHDRYERIRGRGTSRPDATPPRRPPPGNNANRVQQPRGNNITPRPKPRVEVGDGRNNTKRSGAGTPIWQAPKTENTRKHNAFSGVKPAGGNTFNSPNRAARKHR